MPRRIERYEGPKYYTEPVCRICTLPKRARVMIEALRYVGRKSIRKIEAEINKYPEKYGLGKPVSRSSIARHLKKHTYEQAFRELYPKITG